jgi:adenosylcobyric acid synthase
VVPHVPDLHVADEDATELGRQADLAAPGAPEVVVVRLPHISNYDDLLPLQREPGVRVRFERRVAALDSGDLLVVPGSKSTVSDLAWLRESGWARAIVEHARGGGRVLGICGGCQMLGERIEDPRAVESATPAVDGLGLLPLSTRFEAAKSTAQVRLRPGPRGWLSAGLSPDTELAGYEIHAGRARPTRAGVGAFLVTARNGEAVDPAAEGAVDGACEGSVVGTMIHGLLDGAELRSALLRALGVQPAAADDAGGGLDAELDRLEAVVSAALDVPTLWRIAGLPAP